MEQKPKKANFFLIGYPKCGTTALSHFLHQHPDIFLTSPKEPRYFCTDLIKQSDNFHKMKKFFPIRNLKEYQKIYQNWGSEKIAGEATPIYIFSKDAIENIYRYNKNAKLIILIREPVSLLHSLYWQYYFTGNESKKTFQEALDAENTRKKNYRLIPKSTSFPSNSFYSEWIKYTEHLKRVYKTFPKEQVKVIIYEDFYKNQENYLKEIFDFLEVDNNFKPNLKIINSGNKAPKSKLLVIIINIAPLPLKKLIKNSPNIKKIYTKLVKLNKKKQVKHSLSREQELELKKRFKPEVETLSRYLNIDLLKKWNYPKN